MNLVQTLKNRYYRSRPMVGYWKERETVSAKLYRSKEGHQEMRLDGEKYAFLGRPRGTLLYGKLSKLKHEVKNQVFNNVWHMLEGGKGTKVIQEYLKGTAYPALFTLSRSMKYDMAPPEVLVPAIKELWNTLESVSDSETAQEWRKIITFILQEDDAYRFRFQWVAKFMPKFGKPSWKHVNKALEMMEHAEVVEDMKERVRLVRRVLNEMRNDPLSRETIDGFVEKADWNKIKLTEGDKYHFRAKYFKVDYPDYEY